MGDIGVWKVLELGAMGPIFALEGHSHESLPTQGWQINLALTAFHGLPKIRAGGERAGIDQVVGGKEARRYTAEEFDFCPPGGCFWRIGNVATLDPGRGSLKLQPRYKWTA